MKIFQQLSCSAGFVVAAVVWLGASERAAAVFTLTGTAAELVARGINADFETPALARADGEATTTNNMGAGWSFNLISGISNNFGLQDPNNTFYATVAAGPLPAPFEGSQLGFMNLNNWFSTGEVVSNPIGFLRSGEIYTLNVAVGARNVATQNKVAYRVGLRASDGTDLGTFTTATLVPSGSATNITDLVYTLDMSTVPSYVGQSARIVIGGYNTGDDPSDEVPDLAVDQLAQPNFDNVRLAGTFGDPLSSSLSINRQTGEITLTNTGDQSLNVVGYSLTSAAGSFDQSAWLTIADNYDDTPGDGSVDSDDEWTVLSDAGSSTDLSEGEFSGGDGGLIAASATVDLGDAWIPTPFQDVQGRLLLGDGAVLPLTVTYAGTAIPSGDLTEDGNVNTADWTAFKNGQGTDFTGLTDVEGYLAGDMDGDGDHDLTDFIQFRNAYDALNGAGSFSAMLAGVPEPGTFLMLASGSLLGSIVLGRRARRRAEITRTMRRLPNAAMVLVWILAVLSSTATNSPVHAQTLVSHWSFDTATLSTSGANITAAADATGNHNAMVSASGYGGATGMQNVSQPFVTATASVTGQFGQGLRFSGNNFMVYPNLTELMTAAGAPSYSISMWVQWLNPTPPPTSQPFATMGDWGLAAANSGVAGSSSRFVYGFGIQDNNEFRGQSRHHLTSGNGTDIFAENAPAVPDTNDGSWHMLTWTFNTTTGVLTKYYDGVEAEAPTTSTAASFQMANAVSPVGAFGLKGDNNIFLFDNARLDEVWVYTGLLDESEVLNLFECNNLNGASCPITKLRLTVDPADGDMMLDNATGAPITFNSYEITSEVDSLDAGGWNPIANQSVSGFPAGNGTGNGWESGPNSDAGELTEWFLTGDSTLADGESIMLGQGYDAVMGAEDVVLRYALADGSIVRGQVFYEEINAGLTGDYNGDGSVDAADYVVWRKTGINGQQGYIDWRDNFGATAGSGGGSDAAGQSAVPEPATGLMIVIGGLIMLFHIGRPRFDFASVRAARLVSMFVAAVVACASLVASTNAAVTLDRKYLFGDNSAGGNTENGADGIAVGSGAGNVNPGTTIDHTGPTGSYQDLLAASCTNIATCPLTNSAVPVYEDLSTLGRSGLGILFDGTDDYLNGFALNFPPLTRSTYRGGGTGTLNYDGLHQRGYQLWVYPHSGVTAEQHVVSDTTEHGVRISTLGDWMLRHGGTNVDSDVPVTFNEWSHVMAAMPQLVSPHLGVLYVNGVAIAARSETYVTTPVVQAQALIVGADTNADGTMVGRNNFFRGVLDEMEMFVWGKSYNPATDVFTDFGTFNFATDNGYAASVLSGVPGDITNTDGFTQADIDDFVAGWLSEKRVNNIRVGDLTTFADGDLNFDGITDLADAKLLIQAIGGSGAGGLDLSGFAAVTGIPEPSSVLLAGLAVGGLLTARRRQKKSLRRGR
ncbi:MAG: PEP-CTERM sorting domain-containing protein [Pirellulales bacterium]